jgi:hypothetical protein
VILESLHPMQEKVRAEASRFNVVNCGRRWGKTVLGLDVALDSALDGQPVAWFAPKYKFLAGPWADACTTLAEVIDRKSATEKRIELSTGGSLDFWTLDDGDAGRGRKYARAVLDEAAMVKGLEDAWQKAIRPTLADLRGDAWFLSTPRGHDFFWKAYTWGQSPDHPEWHSWTMPTSSNPYIAADEIEAARQQLPERVYQQEFLAIFLDDAGGVFRNVKAAVDPGRKNSTAEQGRSYTLGVDLARVEDFTVLTVMDGTGKQVYHERFNQISWERQCSSIHAVAAKYRAVTYLDSTGVGDPIYERLRQTGLDVLPYQFNNASKERLIDHLAMQIEQGKVRLLDVDDQTNELLAYQYELTPFRNVRMNAPEGMHDDCVISLALAAWGALGAGHYSAGAL